ncbi:MAG TPA: T9SS type A sorting domain-containing protein [Marinilabiliaceae bacterium]|nr:T9SS type A sorting domain-containing protein [Marinilabiliaceae bacterium]
MIKHVLYLVFLFSFFSAVPQGNELIYKKIIQGTAQKFEPFTDHSGFGLYIYWTNTNDETEEDIGIWENVGQSLYADSGNYRYGYIVYNSNFEVNGVALFGNSITWYPDILSASNQKSVLDFKSSLNTTYNLEFLPTIPSITNHPSSSFGRNYFLEFDPTSNVLNGVLNFSSPSISLEPYSGFYSSVFALNGNSDNGIKQSVILNDSLLITYLNIQGQQTLNETTEYTNLNGQMNLVRAELNLNTQALASQLIGSATGSQVVLKVAAGEPNVLYRTGLVRGNNTPISISNTELEMVANDSLYHVYITKETITGQTEWLTELYAYNNVFADTSDIFSQIQVRNRTHSIVEVDNSVFVSNSFRARANEGDSLLYRDFFNANYMLAENFPYHGIGSYHIPYAVSEVYKLDENGSITGRLNYLYTMYGFESNSDLGLGNQSNYLFEVADKLAWVHGYYSVNDTTATFTYTDSNGNDQNTYIDFPAGKGLFILWLDTDLNILNHWLIPYENNSLFGGSMQINSIAHYNSDTLLIQGNLSAHTITTLDPFGDSEMITADDRQSFFAFYSSPELFTDIKNTEKPVSFRIFPNPTSEEIKLKGLEEKNIGYTIFDISGRMVKKGNLSDSNTIHVGELSKGIYILEIGYAGDRATGKFVLQ